EYGMPYRLMVGGFVGFNYRAIYDSAFIGEVGVAVVSQNYGSTTSNFCGVCIEDMYGTPIGWYEKGVEINCSPAPDEP
ncbi:MAG: hypothetical protein IKU90_07690, partial [Clostridia bacterium]|nr:hypothetical protein [Clostridia bacterium]